MRRPKTPQNAAIDRMLTALPAKDQTPTGDEAEPMDSSAEDAVEMSGDTAKKAFVRHAGHFKPGNPHRFMPGGKKTHG